MSPKHIPLPRIAALVLLLASSAVPISEAAPYIWDSNGNGFGTLDGAGTWKLLGNKEWTDSNRNYYWDNAAGFDAVFGIGGVAGAISLEMAAVAHSLTFNQVTGSYTITGATGGSLALDGGGVTANWDATLNAPIILQASQSWNVAAGKTLTVKSTISGSVSLYKTGAGVVDLQGSSTNSGAVQVSAGTLQASNASGSATGSGAVTVKTGASIAGVGFIGGPVVIESGGTAAPGNPTLAGGIGTLTINSSLTANAGSTLDFHVGASGANDHLTINGAFSATPTSHVTLTLDPGYVPTLGAQFDLLDWATLSYSGSNLADTLVLPSISSYGLQWNTSQFQTSGVVSIAVLVPEPSRALLVFSGLSCLLLRRSRRPDKCL